MGLRPGRRVGRHRLRRRRARALPAGIGIGGVLFCRHCGVLLAVVFATDNGKCGAVNVRCLAEAEEFAPEQVVSPQQLAPEVRRERWRSLWTPVRIDVRG